MDRLTTVRFPGPVSDIEAAFVATEPHPDARFLLSFRTGNEFFALRALARQATASLHVTWNRQTYVLDLYESQSPWASVIFETPATNSAPSARPLTPSRLLGLLDTAKAYPLLKQQHPQAVAGIECIHPCTSHDYGDYLIETEEVMRFDAENALVFRVALTNKTAEPIRYVPQSLMVRAGERVFFQSITDATGVIPGHGEQPVYFAITSGSDGACLDLSPRNEFMVLLSRLTPPAPVPALTSSPPPDSPSAAVQPASSPAPVTRYPSPVTTTYLQPSTARTRSSGRTRTSTCVPASPATQRSSLIVVTSPWGRPKTNQPVVPHAPPPASLAP
jgi:hypothetical protein